MSAERKICRRMHPAHVLGATGAISWRPWCCPSCGQTWWFEGGFDDRNLAEAVLQGEAVNACCLTQWAEDDSLGREQHPLAVYGAAVARNAFEAGRRLARKVL